MTKILTMAAATGVDLGVRDGRASMHEQLETLRSRLAAAAKVLPYRDEWFDKDGDVKSGRHRRSSRRAC